MKRGLHDRDPFKRCILSDESTALVPIEEKKVNFYGDEITAVLIEINGQRQVRSGDEFFRRLAEIHR